MREDRVIEWRARELCRKAGLDPNGVMMNEAPAWHRFVKSTGEHLIDPDVPMSDLTRHVLTGRWTK